MSKFILICLIAIFWFHAVNCGCTFASMLTCESQAIFVKLCLAQDPHTCTSTSQCNISAVYDPSTDPNLTKDLIIRVTDQTGYILVVNKLGPAHANNKFPLDVYGVGYKDPVHGQTNIYYNSSALYVADNQLRGAFCGVPTLSPTSAPTFQPTEAPTAVPTNTPTAVPTATPTAVPTSLPTASPTYPPSYSPTLAPTASPTAIPTAAPTAVPSATPTASPTAIPTAAPTAVPSATPTASPTAIPTTAPTAVPSATPTASPTAIPTTAPTAVPSAIPTASPTAIPTALPSSAPTALPTFRPSAEPTANPTAQPTTGQPSFAPTLAPTSQPSLSPTAAPTCAAVSTTDQAYFTVTQQLSNLTSSYFGGSSTAAQAFTDTVSAVLGCTAPTTVTVTGWSRRRLQQSVPVTSVDYKILFGYNGPPSATYNALVAAINNAVTTGHFTALLRSHASLVGVSALDLPTFSNYTVLPPDTNSNGNVSAAASSAGVIAGSVIAVLIALFACLLLICCCRRAPAYKKNAGDEPHPDVFTMWRERLFPRAAPAANEVAPQCQPDVERMPEGIQDAHKSSVATSIASLFTPRTTMSVGSDKSQGAAIDAPAVVDGVSVQQADTESESKEPGEYTPSSDKRLSSRVVIPLNLLPPTGNNRSVQPSADPSSRVPPLPGRQPRRSIKYSSFKRRGSRGSESSKMETISFYSSASHTGTLADLDLALGRFSVERELERQRYHEEYDRGDDAHSQTSDGGSALESSVAWDAASVMSGHTAGGLEFPMPFRGDPLSQVNVQIGWNCLYAYGQYLVELSESPSNLTSFLLEGRHLKALNMPCTQVDSGYFHYASYDDLKGFVSRQLPFSATSCLGRYEDQMLLMVTDARHNLQKDASKKPLWRWVAQELTPDDTIQSGISILVIICAKSTKL